MNYYLAVDIGASSGRHILGWIEGGVFRTQEIYRFSNLPSKENGRLVWDADRLFSSVVEGLKQAKEMGKIPSFVGIDTWGVDYAALDEKGERVGPVYCYRDGAFSIAAEKVHTILPFRTLYSRTGIQFSTFNTVYQLAADRERLRSAKHLLMLPDYLGFLLTGVMKQEYTDATTTGLVNAQTHTWDGEIFSALGLPKLFCPLSLPGTRVAPVKKEIAKVIGYTPVLVQPATHDTASAVLGAPVCGEPYISSGTWSLLGIEQKTAHTDENSRKVNYSNEGSVDYTFRYQKNIMGLWIVQSIRREEEKYSFPELSEMARGVHTDLRIDVNDDRFLAPSSMSAEIDNALGKKLDLPTRMRVVYESLAECYAKSLKELETNVGKTYDCLHIIGGGSRDTFLNERTAEATGKRVITGPVEATAIGNLSMQMISAGEISNLASAREFVRKSFDIKEVL